MTVNEMESDVSELEMKMREMILDGSGDVMMKDIPKQANIRANEFVSLLIIKETLNQYGIDYSISDLVNLAVYLFVLETVEKGIAYRF